MSFRSVLETHPLDELAQLAERASQADVERALRSGSVDLEGFAALLSPTAAGYLEEMAGLAQALTRERFGRVVQMYAPLYVSSECTNACAYCGFNRDNEIRRTTLTATEVETEARLLWTRGFRNLLLVSGEAPKAVPVSYFEHAAQRLQAFIPSLSVEIYPLSREDYARLVGAGIDGLTLYQETYDPELYARVHPSGRKADYAWRLEAPGRGAAAGMRRLGIGALLGLGPWRREAAAMALHGLWLQRTWWQAQLLVSFPRLRRAPGGFAPTHPVSDAEVVQLACALRLLFPDAGLVLSTRESAKFRDGLSRICITQMSAGSCTEPGGYSHPGERDGQFCVEDARPPEEVARSLLEGGLEPVWKDWDDGLRAPGSGRPWDPEPVGHAA